MTHTREADPALFPQFIKALQPLIEQKKFGVVLVQFPHSFHSTRKNRDYLRTFRERLLDLPLVVEFRNAYSLNEQTFAFLRELHLGFLLRGRATLARAVRLHVWQRRTGRVGAKIRKLNQVAETVFAFANNHYRAQGVDTARQLRLLLE
jgi:uncharacterized protein YecE (DUF72 family)